MSSTFRNVVKVVDDLETRDDLLSLELPLMAGCYPVWQRLIDTAGSSYTIPMICFKIEEEFNSAHLCRNHDGWWPEDPSDGQAQILAGLLDPETEDGDAREQACRHADESVPTEPPSGHAALRTKSGKVEVSQASGSEHALWRTWRARAEVK
ncbi:hypothetical protein CEXT_718031 [Caerostris extrusa]|uniref:Uncharacterized protein n=1 Tax=Caerostris extrusa TaxID=172846 RepID=A0AAV4VI18_CAEEX|nr:hypothetical protein CEXT_718031 [Caerostris extrusa]